MHRALPLGARRQHGGDDDEKGGGTLMAEQYNVSHSGAQVVKAIKAPSTKKGKAVVKTGNDLRTGKK